VRLLVGRIKSTQGADIGVLFGRQSEFVRKLVGDAGSRREVKVAKSATPRIVEDRVGNEIDLVEMEAEDGPNLGSEPIGVPIAGVVTEFKIASVKQCALVVLWGDKEHPNFETVEGRAVTLGAAVERKIEARFQPVGYTVGPLCHAVEGMIRDDRARKTRRFEAIGREVIVPGQIEYADGCDRGVVDLDFVGLSENGERRSHENRHRCQHIKPHSFETFHAAVRLQF